MLFVDILVVLSGERSALLYMFMSTFLIAILISKWKIYRITAFILSILISFIIISTNENIKERVVTKTIDQTNLFGEKMNAFSVQHQVIYTTSLKIFKDYPFFGIGPKNFREKCKETKYKTYSKLDQSIDGCQAHPHNTYIQLLVETGIFGFISVFILFIYLNYLLIRQFYYMIFKRQYIINDLQVCMIVATYINLWPLVPTGNFFGSWLCIIYFLPLGFILEKLNNINN